MTEFRPRGSHISQMKSEYTNHSGSILLANMHSEKKKKKRPTLKKTTEKKKKKKKKQTPNHKKYDLKKKKKKPLAIFSVVHMYNVYNYIYIIP